MPPVAQKKDAETAKAIGLSGNLIVLSESDETNAEEQKAAAPQAESRRRKNGNGKGATKKIK